MMASETEVTVTLGTRRSFFLIGFPALVLTLAYTMADTVLTDLIVYRTCLVSLNINRTECSMLQDNGGSPQAMNLETMVEPYASQIVMTNSLIKTILPGILALFLGPWSDRAGRKPLLLATFCGTILMYTILTLLCNWDISPWYLMLPVILGNIVGGTNIGRLALICHISDTAGDHNKIALMAVLEASLATGSFLGGIAGSFIYKKYGYTHIFATAAICHAFGLIHTYFFIIDRINKTSKESIRGLFKISSVKELFASFFVKREGFHRTVVWLSIFALTLTSLVYRGVSAVNLLFTRARLGWDVQLYFYFNAAESVIRLVGTCGVSLRSRFPGTPDTVFAFISFVSALGCALVKSVAWKSWHMYLSAFVAIFSGVAIPVMRSIISKFVPAQDVGKMFALESILDTLSAFGGTALHTMVYSHYLPPAYPSPVYLLSVSFYIVLLICVLSIETSIRTQRKQPLYSPAAQEEDLH